MKKILASAIALLLLLALLCSCGGKNASDGFGKGEESGSGYYDEISSDPPKQDSANDPSSPEQKLIKRYRVTLETTEYDRTRSEISALVESYGGYFSSSSERGGGTSSGRRSSRYGEFTVRIPAEKLDEFISELGGKGNVISSNLITDDVTESYYSYQSRLDALALQEQRILDMMAKADSLDYLIKLEDKLSQIRSEINELNYRLKYYDKSVNYSYVTVNLREVIEYTEEPENTFVSRLGNALKNTFVVFGTVLGEILIIAVWILPFALSSGAVAIITVLAVKHGQKKKRSAKTDDTEQK